MRNKTSFGSRSRRSAFTLIEMMVVVAIIGLLTTCITLAVEHAMDKARQEKAKSDVKQLVIAAKLYRLHEGRHPEKLEALVKHGYLEEEELSLDPWGQPYILRLHGRRLEVLSFGADRAAGGEGFDADISSKDV